MQANPDRSLAAAIQNINGMSAIFSLIPVLTGKVQNVKMIVSRSFPASLVFAGLGAGRVLTKLQLGVLLLSCEHYRNLVGEFTYHHDEYVNKFSPDLLHVPSATPERHSSNIIINHNPTEAYMVEAWFQTQGRPARVELMQNNNLRVFVGILLYTLLYGAETYLAMRNAATRTGYWLIGMHTVTGVCWITAICVLQTARGQGRRFMQLNGISAEYRCFRLPSLGHHVQSVLLSTHLQNIRDFNIFQSQYESNAVKVTGGVILTSGIIDILATILLVGLNRWAYGWLAYQGVIIFIKVGLSVEPLRQITIQEVWPLDNTNKPKLMTRLPLEINITPELAFLHVGIHNNIVAEQDTQIKWQSHHPGLYIGQPYFSLAQSSDGSQSTVRYLALSNNILTLSVVEPPKESNQALQREFLSCLADIVKANKVASWEFVIAIEVAVNGIKETMEPEWFNFGTKDLLQYLRKCKDDVLWRHYL